MNRKEGENNKYPTIQSSLRLRAFAVQKLTADFGGGERLLLTLYDIRVCAYVDEALDRVGTVAIH